MIHPHLYPTTHAPKASKIPWSLSHLYPAAQAPRASSIPWPRSHLYPTRSNFLVRMARSRVIYVLLVGICSTVVFHTETSFPWLTHVSFHDLPWLLVDESPWCCPTFACNTGIGICLTCRTPLLLLGVKYRKAIIQGLLLYLWKWKIGPGSLTNPEIH